MAATGLDEASDLRERLSGEEGTEFLVSSLVAPEAGDGQEAREEPGAVCVDGQLAPFWIVPFDPAKSAWDDRPPLAVALDLEPAGQKPQLLGGRKLLLRSSSSR